MKRPVYFLAHPVGAPDHAGVAANLLSAARWLRFVRAEDEDTTITAPWLGPLVAGIDDDHDPVARDRGIRDNIAVIARCDGIVLCGGRVSTGMQVELDAAIDGALFVCDLTSLGQSPPDARFPFPGKGRMITWGIEQWWRRETARSA